MSELVDNDSIIKGCVAVLLRVKIKLRSLPTETDCKVNSWIDTNSNLLGWSLLWGCGLVLVASERNQFVLTTKRFYEIKHTASTFGREQCRKMTV